MTTETITLHIERHLARYLAWYIHDRFGEICRSMADQYDIDDAEEEIAAALNGVYHALQGTKP